MVDEYRVIGIVDQFNLRVWQPSAQPLGSRDNACGERSTLRTGRDLRMFCRYWVRPSCVSSATDVLMSDSSPGTGEAFLDDGFDADDADLRANATFSTGVGFLHLHSVPAPHPAASASRTSC